MTGSAPNPISDFDGLVGAARTQPRAQRLLFVFVRTSLQKDASAAERARYEAGKGGALLPLFCVDFGAHQVESFQRLATQADEQSTEWDKVLVACIDEPNAGQAEPHVDHALKSMIARVHAGGDLSGYLCFARDGTPLLFD
jgi:hypothetical protein